jgi:ectoine hydroxylase-related dioxygenase (phytanoyl-CoA dioxygenase family)
MTRFLRDGYEIVQHVLSSETVDAVLSALASVSGAGVRKSGESAVYAIRNLLAIPAVVELARSKCVRELVEPVLGQGAFAVRGILFDKIPSANWRLLWHQDIAIAVRAQIDVLGFGGWSVKADLPHVQPPAEILQNMLAVRLHLDDCGVDNGALRVLPGSHLNGRLDSGDIRTFRASVEERICIVPRGGALLMRPLLLHASSASESPRHRRVIHLEYANTELPGGLEWHDRV